MDLLRNETSAYRRRLLLYPTLVFEFAHRHEGWQRYLGTYRNLWRFHAACCQERVWTAVWTDN